MTNYNKSTYRIDSVADDMTPASTFHLRKENRDITYAEYYRTRWNRPVTNMTQPLLVTVPTKRDRNRGDANEKVHLIPELCGMTGLTEEMRANFTQMSEVQRFTRQTPSQRVDGLMRFRRRLAECQSIQNELRSWGLQFSDELVQCHGRKIPNQTIVQGNASYPVLNDKADWSGQVRSKLMAKSTKLANWFVVCPFRMQDQVLAFIGLIQETGRGMGFQIDDPKKVYVEG